MLIRMIDGATRTLGLSQGYLGLPLRDEIVACTVNGRAPCMITAWEPTPQELQKMFAGASLYVRLLGNQHPPISVYVTGDQDTAPAPGGKPDQALELALHYLQAHGCGVPRGALVAAFRLMVAAAGAGF